MRFTRFYFASMLLSFVLSAGALFTLLPAVGLTELKLYAPVSTLSLLSLVWINCMVRAELKRKAYGR